MPCRLFGLKSTKLTFNNAWQPCPFFNPHQFLCNVVAGGRSCLLLEGVTSLVTYQHRGEMLIVGPYAPEPRLSAESLLSFAGVAQDVVHAANPQFETLK